MLGGETHTEKVLGTVWLPKEDKFSFKISVESTSMKDNATAGPMKLTKRQILSKLAGIFDPIGAGPAVLIKPKIALQQLWQIGLSWDEEVPPNERIKWMTLFEEMTALNDVKFDHCLTPPGASGDPSLIVFCDASRLAFGACAYARWKLIDGRSGTRFVAAKTRVAPLKELTIPRLELQAAVLRGRLGKSIQEESRFSFERVHYLSDSCVAEPWVKAETPSFKPFVSCRSAEIQSNSSPENWSHCPTSLSVADDLTKGISAGEVHGRWFNGPEFLQLPEELWPMEHGVPDMAEVNKERRKIQIICALAVHQPVLNRPEFSSWRRLLRVTAYVVLPQSTSKSRPPHRRICFPSLRFASFILPKAFLNRVGFPIAGGILRYRNRNGLDANLRPLSSQHFISNSFFCGIRNVWFTRMSWLRAFFSFGTDFKSMYLTRLDKCEYFRFR